jgi:hypothetical protein
MHFGFQEPGFEACLRLTDPSHAACTAGMHASRA